jgi:hypothetical protein
MTIILLIYLPLCILVGCLAISKNRSFFGWFLLSIFFSPIIAILGLIVVPVLPEQDDDVLLRRRRTNHSDALYPRRQSAPLPVRLLIAFIILVIGVPLLMTGLFMSSPAPAPITQAKSEATVVSDQLSEFAKAEFAKANAKANAKPEPVPSKKVRH